MAERVKDPALLLLLLCLQLWCRFDPWPGNFCMPQVQSKKRERAKNTISYGISF